MEREKSLNEIPIPKTNWENEGCRSKFEWKKPFFYPLIPRPLVNKHTDHRLRFAQVLKNEALKSSAIYG